MHTLSHPVASRARFTASFLLAALMACGGGGDGGGGGTGPNPASTTYTGFMTADDGSSAGLALTFASAVAIRGGQASLSAPVAVTGTASLVGGGSIALSGSVDAGDFTATGGGLTLTGSLSEGVLNGRFTGPGGVAGGFVAAAASSGHAVYAYCGRYTGTVVGSSETESGNWHVLVSGKDVVGDIIPDGSAADASLTGFLGSAHAGPSGTTIVSVDIGAGEESLTADGVITADWQELSGTYSKRFSGLPDESSDGEFAGERCPGL